MDNKCNPQISRMPGSTNHLINYHSLIIFSVWKKPLKSEQSHEKCVNPPPKKSQTIAQEGIRLLFKRFLFFDKYWESYHELGLHFRLYLITGLPAQYEPLIFSTEINMTNWNSGCPASLSFVEKTYSLRCDKLYILQPDQKRFVKTWETKEWWVMQHMHMLTESR